MDAKLTVWGSLVRQRGGVPSTMPHEQDVLAEKYPADVYVPKVNAGGWRMPDAYTNSPDGRPFTWYPGRYTTSLAYYRANSELQEAWDHADEPTRQEVARVGPSLMDGLNNVVGFAKWGILALLAMEALKLGRVVAERRKEK